MKGTDPSGFKRNSLAAAISFTLLSGALTPVYASDTEVYSNALINSTVSPSLIMMFDTSGSMFDSMTDDNAPVAPALSRVQTLVKAMNQILNGDSTVTPQVKAVPGFIKMGLSRYHPTDPNGKGGYVSYPARPLDSFVQINPDGFVTSLGASGTADAEQGSSSTTTAQTLTIGMNGGVNQAVGLQFANVRVPKSVTVDNAYIELTAKQANSGNSVWEITAQAAGDAPDFSSTAINSRTYGTTFVSVAPATWAAGDKIQIPVTTALQDVINRSDWCGGNGVVLRIRDVGSSPTTRVAYSYEGATAAANTALKPKLVVNYIADPNATNSCIKNTAVTSVFTLGDSTVTATGGQYDDVEWNSTATGVTVVDDSALNFNTVTSTTGPKVNVVGLRFAGIKIPQGRTIQKAVLQLTSNSDYTSVQASTVRGLYNTAAAPSLPLFCTSGSSCTRTDTQANALLATTNTAALNVPSSINKNYPYLTDVTSIVQEMVNLGNWSSDSALGFTIRTNTSTTKSSAFYSRNGSTAKSATLKITWVEPTVTDLSRVGTVRDEIQDVVDNLVYTTGGNTPLGAAYAESARYMYGLKPYNTATTDYDSRVVTGSGSTLKYVTPITDTCSANYIFLLTDGDPTATAGVKGNTDGIVNAATSCTSSSDTATQNWDCMLKLAKYNKDKRLFTNTVIIGPLGGTAETQMKATATAGGGKYYKANQTSDLVTAITETVDSAIAFSGTVAAAGVAVNQLSRLNHLNELYYAVFEPQAAKYRWDGNLKRYAISDDASMIIDTNNANAIDAASGFFKATAKSWWSTSVDGADATIGGAASVLPLPDSRKMYTYLSSLTSTVTTPTALTRIDTTDSTFNTNAKAFLALGVSGSTTVDAKYQNLMNWYKGYIVPSIDTATAGTVSTTSLRNNISAALHSQPVLINYGYSGAAGTDDPTLQTNYVFFSTLEGTLHAINSKTGAEAFSFIPGEKLKLLTTQYYNPISDLPAFGMDLTWTYYRLDSNNDGQITPGVDKVYLYGGMRMGGSNYYALDVTDINNPKLQFAIAGGVGKYIGMGQTWSQPVLGQMRIGGTKKLVLIFGGGYDKRHETADTFSSVNDDGNQLFIIDAETGKYIWSASGDSGDNPSLYVPEMKFSVPMSPQAVDKNADGLIDSLYFGDLGGQVFRADINNSVLASAPVKRVRLLAKLGETETQTVVNQHRFYETPEVALFKDTLGQIMATVSMGSGYRSHPLNISTQDKFYVLFDYDLPRANLNNIADTSLQPVLQTSDLYSISATSTSGSPTTNNKGWYINFPESGEKTLASGLVAFSRLLFTTYVPSAISVANCAPVIGKTKLYSMCMPYGDVCDAGANRITDNVAVGIGGEPQLVITKSSSSSTGYRKSMIVGTSIVGGGGGGGGTPYSPPAPVQEGKWREKTRNPAN